MSTDEHPFFNYSMFLPRLFRMSNSLKNLVLELVRLVGRVLASGFSRTRVLFVIQQEVGFLNQIELMKELSVDSKFDVRYCFDWMVRDGFRVRVLRDLECLAARHARFARLLPWHYVIVTDGKYSRMLFRGITLYMQHGSAIGNQAKRSDSMNPSLLKFGDPVGMAFLTGIGVVDQIRTQVPQHYLNPSKAFFVCGVPKLEGLKALLTERLRLHVDLGLDPEKQTVLISSHWTARSVLHDLGIAVVEAVRRQLPDCNVLVTAHPRLWQSHLASAVDGLQLQSELRALESSSSGIRFIQTGPPKALMAIADILVTDHTSMRVEWALSEKPAALYRSQGFTCEWDVVDELYRDASEVFGSLPELAVALQKIEAAPDKRALQSRRLANYFIADTDGAAARMKQVLEMAGGGLVGTRSYWRRVRAVAQRQEVLWRETFENLALEEGERASQ